MPQEHKQDQAAGHMGGGHTKDGKGGKDLNPDDFRLWREFTRDIDPLEEPDWESLEKLIHEQSPKIETARGEFNTVPVSASLPGIKPPTPKQPPQLDARTEDRLRKGRMPIDGTLDLHGHNQEQAHRMLNNFILSAYGRDKRCLLVITGKGKSKAGGALFDVPEGILKQRVPDWLSLPPLRDIVLKIIPARINHGGSGAIYVYLKRKREI